MDGKRARGDRALARIAERQHGVVSIGQLRGVGISEDAILGRVRAGRLHRVHRGVYAVGHVAPSFQARWMAAVLACGWMGKETFDAASCAAADGVIAPTDHGRAATVLACWGAALSHRSAAGLWELLPAREAGVHVSVSGTGGRRRRSGIYVHRSSTLLLVDVTLRKGIPVTTPARTLSDLHRCVSTRSIAAWELRRAIRQADVLGLPTGEEVEVDGTRSDLERDFLRFCRRRRLPEPEVNVRIDRYLVDFLWRGSKLVVETDGYDYHRGRVAFEGDRARDLALRVLGYEVVRLAGRQLADEPERIAGVLSARLARFP